MIGAKVGLYKGTNFQNNQKVFIMSTRQTSTKKYAIIKENNPVNKYEPVRLGNNFKNTKYALFVIVINKNQTETIESIYYSDSIEDLTLSSKTFKSWYNYPLGVCKYFNGNLKEI